MGQGIELGPIWVGAAPRNPNDQARSRRQAILERAESPSLPNRTRADRRPLPDATPPWNVVG